ncbi:hypothetical protein HNP33_004179 [Comamonas odontotermitis]|uniref:Uncharacterized protein n=1 Tax=Comamonas odontotermitis TaxID=379895 RepID=A0ABR6RLK6_9BURK|nr:hypothetical protein [Comamonas odontotermitis]MBB6580053.1 hypothetical protein [Comamonas odontotermitis]
MTNPIPQVVQVSKTTFCARTDGHVEILKADQPSVLVPIDDILNFAHLIQEVRESASDALPQAER